jgi:hypothetical protein
MMPVTLPLLVILQAPSDFERVVDVMAGVATIIIALAIIVVSLAAIAVALKVRGMVKRVRGDMAPVRKHLEAAAANVEYVSLAVRQDVEAVSRTVKSASEKAQVAADAAGKRLAELNALMDVVQAEAEDIFIRTASTVRGVQAGAGAFARMTRGADGPMDDDTMDGAPPRRRRTILD